MESDGFICPKSLVINLWTTILALVVYILHFIGRFEYDGIICPWITVNKFMENYFGVSSIYSLLGWSCKSGGFICPSITDNNCMDYVIGVSIIYIMFNIAMQACLVFCYLLCLGYQFYFISKIADSYYSSEVKTICFFHEWNKVQ